MMMKMDGPAYSCGLWLMGRNPADGEIPQLISGTLQAASLPSYSLHIFIFPLKLDKHGGGASLSFWSLWRSPPSKPIKIFKRGKFIKKPNEGRLFKLIKYQVRLTLMEAYFDQKLEVERQKIWDCAASLSNIERADISKPERFFERDISW